MGNVSTNQPYVELAQSQSIYLPRRDCWLYDWRFQTLSVAYASEVCPGELLSISFRKSVSWQQIVCLRGYLCTYANICWVIGQILASGVLRGMLGLDGVWSYKIRQYNICLFSVTIWHFLQPLPSNGYFHHQFWLDLSLLQNRLG